MKHVKEFFEGRLWLLLLFIIGVLLTIFITMVSALSGFMSFMLVSVIMFVLYLLYRYRKYKATILIGIVSFFILAGLFANLACFKRIWPVEFKNPTTIVTLETTENDKVVAKEDTTPSVVSKPKSNPSYVPSYAPSYTPSYTPSYVPSGTTSNQPQDPPIVPPTVTPQTTTVVDTTVHVTGITVIPTEVTMTEGKTKQLTATVTPEGATNKTVIWSTSDSSKATVDSTGKVTALKKGEVIITATTQDGGKSATCKVTVVSSVIEPESITADPDEVSLKVGEYKKIETEVFPRKATYEELEWVTSNREVATVNDNGKIIAKSVGTCTVTVKIKGTSVKDKVKVTVTEADSVVNVTGISLDPTTMALKVAQTGTITATVTPANATNKSISWSSSNPSVATVSNGNVVGVSEGTATITATTADGNKTAQCVVTVTKDAVIPTIINVTGVDFTPHSANLIVGDTLNTSVSISPANATNKAVSYSSNNSAVATVDSNGIITAVGEGTATIKVTTSDGNFTDFCNVVVANKVNPTPDPTPDPTPNPTPDPTPNPTPDPVVENATVTIQYGQYESSTGSIKATVKLSEGGKEPNITSNLPRAIQQVSGDLWQVTLSVTPGDSGIANISVSGAGIVTTSVPFNY